MFRPSHFSNGITRKRSYPACNDELDMKKSKSKIELHKVRNVLVGKNWHSIGLQLGIKPSKLKDFSKEIDPLAEVLEYWFEGNIEDMPVSWETLVAVLQTQHVDERGLAQKIYVEFCQSNGTDTDFLTETSFPQKRKMDYKTDPLVRHRLNQILTRNRKEIVIKFTNYVDHLRDSLEKMGISAKGLRSYLLSLLANTKHEPIPLFSNQEEEELERKDTITDIFSFLNKNCASFLNYEIFEIIQSHYDIVSEKEELKYCEHIKAFIEKHNIAEFTEVNPWLQEKAKLIFKFDIEHTSSLAKIDNLKKTVAEILGMEPLALELLDIEEGCVIVRYLIQTSLAQAFFTADTVFTPQQRKRFQDESILWLKCNGHTFNFEIVEEKAHSGAQDVTADGNTTDKDEESKRTKLGTSDLPEIAKTTSIAGEEAASCSSPMACLQMVPYEITSSLAGQEAEPHSGPVTFADQVKLSLAGQEVGPRSGPMTSTDQVKPSLAGQEAAPYPGPMNSSPDQLTPSPAGQEAVPHSSPMTSSWVVSDLYERSATEEPENFRKSAEEERKEHLSIEATQDYGPDYDHSQPVPMICSPNEGKGSTATETGKKETNEEPEQGGEDTTEWSDCKLAKVHMLQLNNTGGEDREDTKPSLSPGLITPFSPTGHSTVITTELLQSQPTSSRIYTTVPKSRTTERLEEDRTRDEESHVKEWQTVENFNSPTDEYENKEKVVKRGLQTEISEAQAELLEGCEKKSDTKPKAILHASDQQDSAVLIHAPPPPVVDRTVRREKLQRSQSSIDFTQPPKTPQPLLSLPLTTGGIKENSAAISGRSSLQSPSVPSTERYPLTCSSSSSPAKVRPIAHSYYYDNPEQNLDKSAKFSQAKPKDYQKLEERMKDKGCSMKTGQIHQVDSEGEQEHSCSEPEEEENLEGKDSDAESEEGSENAGNAQELVTGRIAILPSRGTTARAHLNRAEQSETKMLIPAEDERASQMGDRSPAETKMLISAEDERASQIGDRSSAEPKMLIPAEDERASQIGDRSPAEPKMLIPAEDDKASRMGDGEEISEEEHSGLVSTPPDECKESKGHVIQPQTRVYQTAQTPEYTFSISKAEFEAKESHWTDSRIYIEGDINLETKVSLLTNIIDPVTHYRTNRAVILLTIENRSSKHRYDVQTKVTLYDPKLGRDLNDSTTSRQMIKDDEDYVKFAADIGPDNVIKRCKSRKLQLRVKVKVVQYHLESAKKEKVTTKGLAASLASPETETAQQQSSESFSTFEDDTLSLIEYPQVYKSYEIRAELSKKKMLDASGGNYTWNCTLPIEIIGKKTVVVKASLMPRVSDYDDRTERAVFNITAKVLSWEKLKRNEEQWRVMVKTEVLDTHLGQSIGFTEFKPHSVSPIDGKVSFLQELVSCGRVKDSRSKKLTLTIKAIAQISPPGQLHSISFEDDNFLAVD